MSDQRNRAQAGRPDMTTTIRLAVFGAGLALAFAASWLLGSAFAAPEAPANQPPATVGRPHESGH